MGEIGFKGGIGEILKDCKAEYLERKIADSTRFRET